MKRRLIEIFILVGLLVIIIYLTEHESSSFPEDTVEFDLHNEDTVLPQFEYGINVDSLIVIRGTIKKNQFLSEILQDFNIDYIKIDQLAKESRSVFDVRKFKAGNSYAIICSADSLQEVQYFIYVYSPWEYYVYDLKDSVLIYKGEKKIIRKMRYASGIIESSLWNAMVFLDLDVNMANELSEIFAWTIDFFGIQKGDEFKVIFEEKYVDDEYFGLGRIHAAAFKHMDNDFFTCYFEKDSIGDYYDDEGGSMRRTFLKAPLRFRRISSGYSHSRYHPILKIRRPHLGVDYAAAHGTSVYAIGDGIVSSMKWTSQGGRTIHIKHNGTYSTAYLHLSAYGKGVKTGVKVKQGQLIGYVGSTGLATGPHLDFRFYRNGKAIDPLKVKSPPAKPVDSMYFEEYIVYCDSMKNALNNPNRY